MSTYTPTIERPFRGAFIFVLAVLAALMAMAATKILASPHAYLVHQADAEQSRNCLEKHGAWKAYREPNGTLHLLCKYPWETTIYDVIVVKIQEGLFQEKSAYSPKKGIWSAVEHWLTGKGATPVRPPSGPFEIIGP